MLADFCIYTKNGNVTVPLFIATAAVLPSLQA